MTRIAHFLSALLLIAGLSSTAQEWGSFSSLPLGHGTDHGVAFSLDGLGYIATGTTIGGETDRFFQYDPTADAWTELDAFPGGARGYSIGDVWDGKAYMGFGLSESGPLHDLWEFDPTTMEWTELSSCPCTARYHPAFVALDGKIYAGLGSSGGNMKDWWVYDIASDEWTQLEDLPAPERHHPYQFAANGKIYTGFGHGNEAIFNTWFEYNPSSATWTELDHLPSEGRVAGTQFSYGGYGFALSGDGDEHTSMETGEFWQYLPTTDSWVALTPHPGESRWAPSSFVIGTDLYFMNGMSNLFGQWQYNMENFKIDLESVVNVEEANASTSGALSGPEVYPTATNGLFNVQGGAAGAVLEVLDLAGRVLRTYACNANGEVLGDLSGLANGAYLVHWAGSDEPASRIIKH